MVHEVKRIKRRRMKSVNNPRLMRFEEGVESTKRKMNRQMSGKKKDMVLYDKWACAEQKCAGAVIWEKEEADFFRKYSGPSKNEDAVLFHAEFPMCLATEENYDLCVRYPMPIHVKHQASSA